MAESAQLLIQNSVWTHFRHQL